MKYLCPLLLLTIMAISTANAITCSELLVLKTNLDLAKYEENQADNELASLEVLISDTQILLLTTDEPIMITFYTNLLNNDYKTMHDQAVIHENETDALQIAAQAAYDAGAGTMTAAQINTCLDTYSGYSCASLRASKAKCDTLKAEVSKATTEQSDIISIILQTAFKLLIESDANMRTFWINQLNVLLPMGAEADIHLQECNNNFDSENIWFSEIALHMGLDDAATCLNSNVPSMHLNVRVQSRYNDYLIKVLGIYGYLPLKTSETVYEVINGGSGIFKLKNADGTFFNKSGCAAGTGNNLVHLNVDIEDQKVNIKACNNQYVGVGNFLGLHVLAFVSDPTSNNAILTLEFVH